MYTRYNKEEDEEERIYPFYESSTPDPNKPGQVIESDDETETT